MKTSLNFSKELQKNPIFTTISDISYEMEIPSFVVGGYVRDLLLKKDSKDIDIVCLGNSIDLARRVATYSGVAQSFTFFKNFGTAKVNFDNLQIEFVTARKESYKKSSRNPEVTEGTFSEDQKRRDFTINALSLSLKKENFGELIDPFDGVKHLQEKLICTPLTPPHQTFSDDPLRMMRAIRFATQLDFDIEHTTFEAIQKNADRITIVSIERVVEELNKIIMVDKPSIGFKLLYHAKLLDKFLPELIALMGREVKNGISHKDNFYHTLQVLDNVSVNSSDIWVRWAALLHDIGKPKTKKFDNKLGWTFHGHDAVGVYMVKRIFKRLKLPLNHKMRKVQKLVQLHLRPISLVKEGTSETAIRRLLFEASEDFEDLMLLCKADITSKNEQKTKKFIENFEKLQEKSREIESNDKIKNFQPIFTGHIMMQLFEIEPGKTVGDIKSLLKENILNGKIKNTMKESYVFVKNYFHSIGVNEREDSKQLLADLEKKYQ